jgi:hypothetical protein
MRSVNAVVPLTALLIVAACGSSAQPSAGARDAGPGSPCNNDSDCTGYPGGLHCAAGGFTSGCGACMAGNCNNDADCVAALDGGSGLDAGVAGPVCLRIGCVCTGVCSAPCTGCTDAEACAPNGHCVPKPCTTAADCPRDYACAADGTCESQPCSHDSDCGPDHCVNGTCWENAGSCVALAR